MRRSLGTASLILDVYDNWRLVWAAAAIRIAASCLVGDPGSIAEHPARLRAEVARIVSELVPANAGSPVRTPYGTGRVLSDPGAPAARLPRLQRAAAGAHLHDRPERVRRAGADRARGGRFYALALMASDGQLTHSGCSMEQSWVLAVAGDLGALRATQDGPEAGVWRAFAERALDRLVRVHGTFADGTTPVIPGLRERPDQSIADIYSSMSQYNGLSLYLIEHAAAHWPEAAAGTLAVASRPGPDLGPRRRRRLGRCGATPGNVCGGRSKAWRTASDDGRYSQGIVDVKVRSTGGWRDLLASRPNSGAPRSDWPAPDPPRRRHCSRSRARPATARTPCSAGSGRSPLVPSGALAGTCASARARCRSRRSGCDAMSICTRRCGYRRARG